MMALELQPAALFNKAGSVIDSPAFNTFDEVDFERYEAAFSPKLKEHTPSQELFQFQISMIFNS